MDRNLFFYFSSTIKSNFTLECHHLWCQLLRLKTTVFSLQNKKKETGMRGNEYHYQDLRSILSVPFQPILKAKYIFP